jgi:hypothetical protein
MNDFKNQLDALLHNSIKHDPEVRRITKNIISQTIFKKRILQN